MVGLLEECLDVCLCVVEDQCVDVVCVFVCIDYFEVYEVVCDVEFVGDVVVVEYVVCEVGDVECFVV